VPVSQGYAPHLVKLQRLQAFRREWPTVPASTPSPTTRRAWRASSTSATGRGRTGAFPRVDGEVNIMFGEHGSQENKRQQKLNDRQILVATTSAPAPYRWTEDPITFTRADQWLNFDHPSKYPLLVDPMIQESTVKKVLVDEGSSINVTFPQTLLGLGLHSKNSTSQTPLSSALCQPKENTRSDTSTCPLPLELRKTTELSS
jgi:hypothetical protein